MAVIAKSGRRWIGFIVTVLNLLSKSLNLCKISEIANAPFVEVGNSVAYELRKLLKKDWIFVPFFFDRASQLMRNRICKRGVSFRLDAPPFLDGNIVKNVQRFDDINDLTSYDVSVE